MLLGFPCRAQTLRSLIILARANVLLGEIVEHVEELIAVRDQEEEYTGQDFGEADLDDSVRVPDLLTFAEVVDSRESDARVWTVLRKNQ